MKMSDKIKLGSLIVLSLLSFQAFAKNATHTWHTVSSANGTWQAKLQMLNEGGNFVTRGGAAITTFNISPGNPQDYGFVLDAGDDFDVAYTLTLTQNDQKNARQFVSKACVYVITARGPAQPDIRVSHFNGAECNWSLVKGVGENFSVS
jgi:hypothetical protein